MFRTIATFVVIVILLGMFFPTLVSEIVSLLEKSLAIANELLATLLETMPS
ncbi:MAG: hypothetical protein WCW66_05945 [Patescibacteria group bacterium]|jgi:hypothetical protein